MAALARRVRYFCRGTNLRPQGYLRLRGAAGFRLNSGLEDLLLNIQEQTAHK